MPIQLNEHHKTWEKACEYLRRELTPHTFSQWFECIVPLKLDGNLIKLGVSDNFFADWLGDNLGDTLKAALKYASGRDLLFELESGHPPANTEKCSDAVLQNDTQFIQERKREDFEEKQKLNRNLNRYTKEYCFENFVVGEENRFAYEASLTAVDAPGIYNPLFIYGPPSLGKTHLLQAMAQSSIRKNPQSVVEYISCEELMNTFVDSIRRYKHWEFRNRFRGVDIFLVDDIHFLSKGTQLQEEFFNTFNTLYQSGKQIVLSSDKQPSNINGLEQRLVSRFEFGVITEILSPSVETRFAILKKKQEQQNIKIDDDILFYIASRITSDVRRLLGALYQLVVYSVTTNQKIDIDVVETHLKNFFEQEASMTSSMTLERIQKKVAEYYNIHVSDLLSNKRPKNIAVPRMIAMYLSRKLTNHSLPEIGREFSRNHATVLHADKRIKNTIKNDEELKRNIAVLERQLKSSR